MTSSPLKLKVQFYNTHCGSQFLNSDHNPVSLLNMISNQCLFIEDNINVCFCLKKSCDKIQFMISGF